MRQPSSLYYICHKDNLKSILSRGILSHNRVQELSLSHYDIHDEEVMNRRQSVLLPNKRPLHEHVNLYFQPRNAMLYRLICNADREDFVILQIKPDVFNQDGLFFSDRNAATSMVHFYDRVESLQKIDGKVFRKKYWTDSDDTKQKMTAEVLLPNKVPSAYIIGIYIDKPNDSVQSIADQFSVSVSIQPDMFFLPSFRKRISNNVSLSQGDMFFSNHQTFTISVNLKGVMGKGLASRTKYQFPDAYVRYQDDCKSGKLKAGKPTLYQRGIRIEEELADDSSLLDIEKINGARWFLFFPTKRDWRDNSRFEDIEASMQWLLKNYKNQGIQSLAMPALGCGLGNLDWQDIGPMMCYYLNQMDISTAIYLPTDMALGDNDHILSRAHLLNAYKP